MRIGLLNWSGHKNIGDDAMAQVLATELVKRGHVVINQGEHPKPDEVDAYFWGGGTLISATGVWPEIPPRKPLIGFGIGVAEHPNSNIPAVRYNFDSAKMIFARDIYSYLELTKYRVPAMLSFDPVFLLDYDDPEEPRDFVAVNIIGSRKTDYDLVKETLEKYKGERIRGFAVGSPEDEQGMKDFGIEFDFFDDPYELYKFLKHAKVAICTRLHANVFAYMANVPEIVPITYDQKVKRFHEYVVNNRIPVRHMREMLNKNLDYACDLLS